MNPETERLETNGSSEKDSKSSSMKGDDFHALGVDPENLQGEGEGSSQSEPSALTTAAAPSVELKVSHNKQLLNITLTVTQTVKDLKDMLVIITGIPSDKQKIMWSKGACSDDKTIEQLGAKTGSKFMMIGSSEQEITNVQSKPDLSTLKSLQESSSKPEKLCEQTMHRKVIDKGIPPDAMPGILGEREDLPPFPIAVMALQMGPTEASRYWLYWVPAQYADAIKEIFSQFELSAD